MRAGMFIHFMRAGMFVHVVRAGMCVVSWRFQRWLCVLVGKAVVLEGK